MRDFVAILLVALTVFACSGERPARVEVKEKSPSDARQLVVGGIYSIESGDGDFGVVKMLALDDKGVHVRVYKNRYPSRPQSIEPHELSMGQLDDPDGFGIGHLPLSRSGFSEWKPELVTKHEVMADELEGYEMWKEAGGEAWP